LPRRKVEKEESLFARKVFPKQFAIIDRSSEQT